MVTGLDNQDQRGDLPRSIARLWDNRDSGAQRHGTATGCLFTDTWAPPCERSLNSTRTPDCGTGRLQRGDTLRGGAVEGYAIYTDELFTKAGQSLH